MANNPDEYAAALDDLAGPDVRSVLRVLGEDAQVILGELARDYDPTAVSALRIVHAVLVAARRKDKKTVRAWEKAALRYMRKHAFPEYVRLPLPPRAGQGRHDRHLILISLRDRIREYLLQCDRNRPRLPAGSLPKALSDVGVALHLQAMVHCAFPNLKPADRRVKHLLIDRIEGQMRNRCPLAGLEPEPIILDALEALGVERAKGQNWLKGTEPVKRPPRSKKQ